MVSEIHRRYSQQRKIRWGCRPNENNPHWRLMKTIRIGGPDSKRIKNRGEAAQYKATASHQAIITREQFEAAQREREQRCNVEGNGAQRVRKSTRYKSTFSIDRFLSTMEE